MRLDATRRETGRSGWRDVLPWLAVVVFLGVGYGPMIAPSPVPATASADRFSAERAMTHVDVIARTPHPMGTSANADVRSYIVAELERLGINVERQSTTVPNFYGSGEPVPVVNLIARIPGTAPTKAIALMGHYDTVPTTPGGNDNTAAVAALLETARALRAGPSLRNDVYLLFTDGEEPAPRFGASSLVRSHSVVQSIGLVVNFEASGGSGASILAEMSGPEPWLVEELAQAEPHPAAFSFLTETARQLGDIGTDFDQFRNAGLTGLHFVYLHGSPIYHTEADDRDAVSVGTLQHHGMHALSIARHFGDLNWADPGPAEPMVFFPVGPLFVRYSSGWVVGMAILATALVAGGSWRRSVRPADGASVAIRRAVRSASGGVLATVAGTIVWLVIVRVRCMPGVIESYVYFGCALGIAVFVMSRIAPRRGPEAQLAVVWLWVALSLLTAFGLPGFSYLFVWPVLAVAATSLRRGGGGPWSRTGRYLVVAATTLILMTPAIDVFLQFAQPRPGNPGSEMKAAVALPLLLAILSVGLLRTVWPGRGSREHQA